MQNMKRILREEHRLRITRAMNMKTVICHISLKIDILHISFAEITAIVLEHTSFVYSKLSVTSQNLVF